MKNERIQWVDFAKGLAIILVVVAHVIPKDTDLIAFIYVFHMPFFFVMAGYLLDVKKWARQFSNFKSKLEKRLIVPYLSANLAFFPLWFIFCYLLKTLAIYGWENFSPLTYLLAIFIGNNYNIGIWLILYPLWFLPCLFFAEIIFLKTYKIFADKIFSFYRVLIVLSAAGYFLGTHFFYQLPLGIDIALVAQIFLLAGFLIRKNNFLDKLNFSAYMILILLFGAAFYCNGYISMHDRNYQNIFLLYIGGICGTLILIKISMILANFGNKIFDFIKFCGRQSLAILIFRVPAIDVAYHLTTIFDSRNAELGLRHLPPDVNLVIIIFSVILPAIIAKKFFKAPVIKNFCV